MISDWSRPVQTSRIHDNSCSCKEQTTADSSRRSDGDTFIQHNPWWHLGGTAYIMKRISRLKCYAMYTLHVIIITSFAILVSCDDTQQSESPRQPSKESGSSKKFVATSEWQSVQKGQPLPAGLHYRLNINTGETEVKLLEPAKHDDHKTDLVALPPEEGDDHSGDSLYMSKRDLKKLLADITADDSLSETESSNRKDQQGQEKFRSYDDLKKDFQSLNLTVKTDMELLNELVLKTKESVNSNDIDQTVTALRDMEYLVHQIDNGREFIRLGGLAHVIIPALNSSFPSVRAEALWLLGSAVQSNPKVQIAVLNAGIMSNLVKAAVLDSDMNVHARAVYAVSCLIRQFPAAQAKLIAEGGLVSLGGIIDSKRSTDFKTKMRVVTLIHDLLLERVYVRTTVKEYESKDASNESEAVKRLQQHKRGELKEKLRQYDATNLEKRLIEEGWCHKLSEFLYVLHESGTHSRRTQRRDDLGSVVSKDVPYRPEHDAVEKVIGTLLAMKDICQDEFQRDINLDKVLRNFLSWYQDLSIREEVLQKQPLQYECRDDSGKCQGEENFRSGLDDGDMYYSSIVETLKKLVKLLEKPESNGSKDEL